ncbi:chromate transporter [Fusobacterium perfoetens]|uniref:chromate transporter n=1 Tax=Fusobacterium perfoetens TaxID=852 RepID=UPI0015A4DAB6|nr:chromate transporter [Fusobacterium perfoetens]MCF2624937.1 chromate transporter [Fusobacterium perfoetens]
MLYSLFIIFFKLGFFSFGGGYTMIPLIEQQLNNYGIVLTPEVLSSVVAIAGVCPGPVGINLAIGFGYSLGGPLGVAAAALGVTLPSIIVVVAVCAVFEKIYHSKNFKAALSGLKPAVVGITFYAAIKFGIKNGIIFSKAQNAVESTMNINFMDMVFNIPSVIIIAVSFLILMKTKVHPIILVVAGAILGVLIF